MLVVQMGMADVALPQAPHSLRKRKAGKSRSSVDSRLLDQLKRPALNSNDRIACGSADRYDSLLAYVGHVVALSTKEPPLAKQFCSRTAVLCSVQAWKRFSEFQVVMNEYYRQELGLGDPRTDIPLSLIVWPALDNLPITRNDQVHRLERVMPWHVIPFWKDDAPQYHVVPTSSRPSIMLQEEAEDIIQARLIAFKAQLLSDPSFMAMWVPQPKSDEAFKLAAQAHAASK
jgi:hypothetical protein